MKSAFIVPCLLLALGLPAAAYAQSVPDPWEKARYRVGPFAFTPRIVLSNLGVDTNVFNAVENPRKDFTFSLDPQVEWWLRAGKLRLHGKDVFQAVYFHEYESQRGLNQNHSLTLEVALLRIQPYVGGSYLDTRERPGYEIDLRARRKETGANTGIVVRLSAKSSLDLGGRYTDIKYGGDQLFDGTFLNLTLNRRVRSLGGTLRHQLTPLTTLLLAADSIQERFVYSPIRDENSFRVTPGVEFKPFALVNGSARVGYRKLNFLSSTVPDFSGLVAAVDLGYTLLGRTRFGAGVSRDIEYSYEITNPYYVLNGVTGSLTQQVAGPWDVVVRGGRQTLAYRQLVGLDASVEGRTDHVETWGGGIGYRVGQKARIVFTVDYLRRRSELYRQNYSGIRAGASVTYGL